MSLVAIDITNGLAGVGEADRQVLERSAAAWALHAGSALKRNLRTQIVAAGLGRRLGNAVRMTFRDVPGVVESTVFSKALLKRPGGITDLIQVFGEGTTIRVRRGLFLVIALKAAGRIRSPLSFEKGALVFLPIEGGRAGLLVTAKNHVPMFLLIRQARLRKRLDLQGPIDVISQHADQDLLEEFTEERQRVGAGA